MPTTDLVQRALQNISPDGAANAQRPSLVIKVPQWVCLLQHPIHQLRERQWRSLKRGGGETWRYRRFLRTQFFSNCGQVSRHSWTRPQWHSPSKATGLAPAVLPRLRPDERLWALQKTRSAEVRLSITP